MHKRDQLNRAYIWSRLSWSRLNLVALKLVALKFGRAYAWSRLYLVALLTMSSSRLCVVALMSHRIYWSRLFHFAVIAGRAYDSFLLGALMSYRACAPVPKKYITIFRHIWVLIINMHRMFFCILQSHKITVYSCCTQVQLAYRQNRKNYKY